MFGRVTVSSVLLVLTLAASANAQFGNMFEQFMGGQQQQRHQAPQNVPSDSAWYQQTYSNGISFSYLCMERHNANITQPIAAITSVQGHYVSFTMRPPIPTSTNYVLQHVCPSLTTAHVNSRQ